MRTIRILLQNVSYFETFGVLQYWSNQTIINSRWSGECNEVNYKVTFFVFLRMSVFEMLIRYKNVFSFLDEKLTDNTRCSIEFCPALTNKYVYLQKLHYYRNPQKPINTFPPLWKYILRLIGRIYSFYSELIVYCVLMHAVRKSSLLCNMIG